MMARKGKWKRKQIIPEDWVAESTASYSGAARSGGYGYMWWVAAGGRHLEPAKLPDGAYTARGAGGHYTLVVPQWDWVVVHRVNTFLGHNVTSPEFGELLAKILEAAPEELTVQ